MAHLSSWTGLTLRDAHGARVGRIVDLRGGEDDGPAWLVADIGRLSPRWVLVPAQDAMAWGGDVSVRWTRTTIRLSPELLRAESPLTDGLLDRLMAHYGPRHPTVSAVAAA